MRDPRDAAVHAKLLWKRLGEEEELPSLLKQS